MFVQYLPWLFFLIFGGLAFGFWLAGRTMERRIADLEGRGRWVDGVVVARPELRAGGDAEYMAQLVAEFRDERGAVHHVRSGGGSSAFPGIGSRVRILYDPARPSDARIEDDMDNARTVLPILILAFGAVAALAFLAGVVVTVIMVLV